jgi:DNA polymerase-3 subunit delta
MSEGEKVITLISGNDEFRIAKRLRQIKTNFADNDLNISTFDGELDFAKIKSESNTLPFLADAKLVIIKELSKIKDKKVQGEIENWLKNIPKNNEFVLIEEELTAKNWLFNSIRALSKVETYNKLKPYEISRWIKETVSKKGGSIDPVTAEKLAAMIGSDLWRLDNEINKLLTFDKKITLKTVGELVEGEFLDSIFVLMDAISEKKRQKALITLNKFMQDDANHIYLFTMLARQVRNLLAVKELSEGGLRESAIVNKLKLHPFVVKNTLRQSKNFSNKELIDFHSHLVEIDYQAKTSGTNSKTALTKLIHQLCQN